MAKHEGLPVLLKKEDAKKYAGKWVAIISWNDNTVVGSGDAGSIAKKEAENSRKTSINQKSVILIFYCRQCLNIPIISGLLTLPISGSKTDLSTSAL